MMCASYARMEGISWSATMFIGICQCAGLVKGSIIGTVCLLRSPQKIRIGNALAITVIFVATLDCDICVSTAL